MLKEITNDLTEALKSGDKFKLSVLRMLKSALQLEEINKKKELSDQEIVNVIRKQIKQRNDSIIEYLKYNQEDKVESIKEEVKILNDYLPEEVSEEKLNEILDKVLANYENPSMKEMGNIMKDLTRELENLNADMSKVSKMVRERLN